MVKIGDKITVYLVMLDEIAFLPKERIMIINDTRITFDEIEKDVKRLRNVNRINKPIGVTFYSDWKNKKITKDSYSAKKEMVITQERKDYIERLPFIE